MAGTATSARKRANRLGRSAGAGGAAGVVARGPGAAGGAGGERPPQPEGCIGRVGRGRVGELQRARILAAMVELVRERGVGAVSVAHVIERSGVSRRTFYELFEDRGECLLAAFDHAVERGAARVAPAYADAGSDWLERVRAGLAALLEFIDDEPAAGGLCVVDALGGGPSVLERRARVVDALVDVAHAGRRETKSARKPGRLVAEGVVGAVLAVLYGRLLANDPEPLVKLLSPLMALVALPYLGPAAAERELARRAPRARPIASRARPSDPLRDLNMRLTYRTVRVLLAIAERPGDSSRQIADASDVADQGQMSKLLWRLEHLGLIANALPRPARGAPNAWTLTAKGREVEQAIRAQTGS